MIGYIDTNGDIRIMLSPEDSARLGSQEVGGLLLDPRLSRRSRELYSLRVRKDDEKSEGTIAACRREGEHYVYISGRLVERLKQEGGVCVSIGSRAIDLREVTADEASLVSS